MPGRKCAFEFLIISGVGKLQTVLELADSKAGDFLELIMPSYESLCMGLEFSVEEILKFEESDLEPIHKLFVGTVFFFCNKFLPDGLELFHSLGMGLFLICSQLPEVLSLFLKNSFESFIIKDHGLHGGSLLNLLCKLQLDTLVGFDNGGYFGQYMIVVFETELIFFVQIS